MKKFLKIIVAITIPVILTGCGVKFGVENRDNEWSFFNINSENEENEQESNAIQNVDITEEINGINNIDISIDVSNIDIDYCDGNDIKINGELSKYSKGINTEKESSKLSIVEKYEKNRMNVSKDSSSHLIISIPKNFNGDLEFNFGVGECNINGLEVDNLVIKNGVGELKLKDISFNKLDLESGVGSVTLETEKKTGEINIEGGIGETNVSLGDINGDLTFEGGMGSATIKVPVDAPIDIDYTSGIGKVKVNAKTSNDTKYKFDIEVGIGEVEVTN